MPRNDPAPSASDLPSVLADAHCRVTADVQKRAKAEWKRAAPPMLFEAVKSTFRIKSLDSDHDVSPRLEALEQAVTAGKLAFDTHAFALAIYERSQHTKPPLATAYLLPRDTQIARAYLEKCLDTNEKKLDLGVSLPSLPDTFFDALPHLRKICEFETFEASIGELTAHRLKELVAGLPKLWLSLRNTTLPPELFGDDLISLTLRADKLTELPAEIGRAKKLWSIDISAPKLKKLPQAMSTLPLTVLSLTTGVPKLDVSVWPKLKYLDIQGTTKSVDGLVSLPELSEYTQRCAAKVPDAIWDVPKLERVWIWYSGFDDFDEVKAKFEKRGVRVAQ